MNLKLNVFTDDDMSRICKNCYSLETVTIDLYNGENNNSYWHEAFDWCVNLKSIDVNRIDCEAYSIKTDLGYNAYGFWRGTSSLEEFD